jgi:hypothetical protein
MKPFLLTGLFLVFFAAFAKTAQAQNPYPTAPVEIRGLSQYRGMYLTAHYAVSSAAGMALDPGQVSISQIYVVVPDLLINQDNLSLPPQEIVWSGISKPNSLVLVIHRQAQFHWINGDGSAPVYSATFPAGANASRVTSSTISLRTLDRLSRLNNGTAIFLFGQPQNPN